MKSGSRSRRSGRGSKQGRGTEGIERVEGKESGVEGDSELEDRRN